MSSTPEFRKEFVERLTWACDANPHIPPQGQGRQQVIADRLKLAPEAVSKWFKAVSMPRPTKMEELSELLGVDQGWLHYGVKPDVDRSERRVRARENDGAVHLVWGLIALSGGYCGLPSPTDPRREYIDFYATVRGRVYPMFVGLAREVAPDVYEVSVPKEFRDLRTVAVVPVGPGKFHYIDMPVADIDAHKLLSSGNYVVQIIRAGTKYTTGDTHWPRIITFGEFTTEADQAGIVFQ